MKNVIPRPTTNRMPVTGGKLNSTNQPIVVTAPAIRTPNNRK